MCCGVDGAVSGVSGGESMNEAICIALIVAGTSIITQLIIAWLQPKSKAKIERKENRRKEIYKCFSEFWGLLGASPAYKCINALTQEELSNRDKNSTDRWFCKFNKLLWKTKMHIGKDNPKLLVTLCRIEDITIESYAIHGKISILSMAKNINNEKMNTLFTELEGLILQL